MLRMFSFQDRFCISTNHINIIVTVFKVIIIGEHFVTLLCETKHRGAFEQAYLGFELMCKQLWRSKEEELRQLPLVWLHYLFLDISGLKNGNFKLCSTRRSAGVPFMVQVCYLLSLPWSTKVNVSYRMGHLIAEVIFCSEL